MSRRRHSDDIEFGSDSFLDVVANIVGILIILIVVAGIKAGTAPVSAERVAEYLQKHVPAIPPKLEPQPVKAPELVKTPEPAKPPAPQEPLVIPPDPALIRKADALKAELATLETQAKTATADTERTSHEQQDAAKDIEKLRQAVATETAELGREKIQLAESQSRLEVRKTGLLQMEVDVQKAEAVKPDVMTLQHKLTPLGRDINGKELHFRLLDNRIAYLPIDELIERLRPQILRQRDKLIRYGIQHGQAGPVAGFRMDYVLEAQRLGPVEELRRGMSVAITLSNWRLVEEPDLDTESVDEALKDKSEFLRRLREADADTTITFWVYPDSYPLYRRLQQFAHHENFTVAARPMPFGVPVAGSPEGSRSSGQ